MSDRAAQVKDFGLYYRFTDNKLVFIAPNDQHSPSTVRVIELKQYFEKLADVDDRTYLTLAELNPKISFARARSMSRIWGEVVLMDKVDETKLPYPRDGELSDDDTALVDDERNFSNPDAADPIYATDEEDDPEPSTPDIHDGITDAVLTNATTSDDDDIASDIVDDCGSHSGALRFHEARSRSGSLATRRPTWGGCSQPWMRNGR